MRQLQTFTHLFVEAIGEDDQRLEPFKMTHKIIKVINGFGGLEYLASEAFKKIPGLTIRLTPKIYILKKERNDNSA